MCHPAFLCHFHICRWNFSEQFTLYSCSVLGIALYLSIFSHVKVHSFVIVLNKINLTFNNDLNDHKSSRTCNHAHGWEAVTKTSLICEHWNTGHHEHWNTARIRYSLQCQRQERRMVVCGECWGNIVKATIVSSKDWYTKSKAFMPSFSNTNKSSLTKMESILQIYCWIAHNGIKLTKYSGI